MRRNSFHKSFLSISIVAVALILVREVRAQDATIANACAMKFALIGGGSDESNYRSLFHETIPTSILPAFEQKRLPTSRIFSQVPLSESEYRIVFPSAKLSKGESDEIIDAGRFFKTLSPDADGSVINSSDFSAYLSTQKDDNIIIVGHNKDGRFAFLDGTSSKISDMVEDCAKNNKNCIFISCRSNDFVKLGMVGVKRDLTLEEGLYIANKLDNWIKIQQNAIGIDEISSYVKNVETTAHLKYHSSYIIMTGCAGAATVVYISVQGIKD